MVLLAAVILPHGTMPFDGDANSESSACRDRFTKLDSSLSVVLPKLYNGICSACESIASLQPDLIILHTPHGISLSDAYGIYTNNEANGDAKWLDLWSEFQATLKLDNDRSTPLVDFLKPSEISVQGIRSFSGMESKLRWGEVVPAWYTQKYLTNDPKYIVISNDSRPHSLNVELWRLDMGVLLSKFVDQLPEKVVVIISGDLSHHHPTDCENPLYLPDSSSAMPVNPEGAAAYEKAMADWVQSGVRKGCIRGYDEHLTITVSLSLGLYLDRPEGPTEEYIWDPNAALIQLTTAAGIDPPGACGMKGFVLLHGLLAEQVQAGGATITSQIFVHTVPTYYGMMAATFIKS